MNNIIDLERFPIDKPNSEAGKALIEHCQQALVDNGMFNLDGFLLPDTIERIIAQVNPLIDTAAFNHKRMHNIYFKPSIPELPMNHPALAQRMTSSYTLCADQLPGSELLDIYHWPVFIRFLSVVMNKPALYVMDDPLAKLNVMAYKEGQELNWHFDRSEFTTTMLLQSADHGGDFEYRTNLRSDDQPNYDGVATLLNGEDHEVKQLHLSPGTLNVFKGKYTAHRVTPVQGDKARIISVFSYYQNPGVVFSETEQMGFYGRTV